VGTLEVLTARLHRAESPARTFQDLIVWQKAHQFVLSVYALTAQFPKSELYGLTSQFRRAAISIPANIAEGFQKRTKPDKTRFMNIAQGSLVRMPLRPHPYQRSALRRHRYPHGPTRRSQQTPQRLQPRHSALLTPDSCILIVG
jgi:hypothetical protein